MLKRCRAPPENMLNMPSSVPFWLEKNAAKRAASIPGTGMNVPIRYTTSAPSRNHRRLRISAKRVMSPRAAVGLLAATVLDLETPAGRFDRALGALGRRDHLVLHGVGLGDLAGQNDLYDFRAFRNQVRLDQSGQGHFSARDAHQIAQGQFGTRGLHGRTEADLRQTPLQGHLSALESDLVVAALARALSLDAAAAGLALAGGGAAPDPQAGALGAGARLDGVQSHLGPRPSAVSTLSMWLAALI